MAKSEKKRDAESEPKSKTKTCFIIMPITTPKPADGEEPYSGGMDHFKHVLRSLFIPAVEAAGFQAVSPEAKGSELIHAGIVNKLDTADLVLCDISSLNPNVFFEFGIRTARNLPVCVVKDDRTTDVPFDTGIIHYHEYRSALHGWEIEAERARLSAHVQETAKQTENQLWLHFGLQSRVVAPLEAPPIERELALRLDTVLEQLRQMQREPTKPAIDREMGKHKSLEGVTLSKLREYVQGFHAYRGADFVGMMMDSNKVYIIGSNLDNEGRRELGLDVEMKYARGVEFESPR